MIVVIKYNIFKRKYVQRIEIGSARSFHVVTFVYSIGFKFMTKPIKKKKKTRMRERERELRMDMKTQRHDQWVRILCEFFSCDHILIICERSQCFKTGIVEKRVLIHCWMTKVIKFYVWRPQQKYWDSDLFFGFF